MAPQWSTDEDRALLLALVQVMASDGPSKNQMEAVIKAVDGRWTLGAATQHYNKKLRHLDPATLGLAGDAAANPSTPVRSSAAKKRKAPAPTTTTTTTPKTPRATAAAARTAIKAAAASPSWSPSASPEPAVKATAAGDRKKKEVVPRAVFPSLRKSVSAAAAAPAASSADEDAEGEDDEDWEHREGPSKKVKRLEDSEVEGEVEEGEVEE